VSPVSVYTLVAIAKKQWELPHSMHQILQVLSVAAFEQVPIPELFTKELAEDQKTSSLNQLYFKDI
jgi:branched-subunit amino acid transport protein